MPRSAGRQKAITRVETIVVAAIVVLAATVGGATLSYVREEARSEVCSSILARYGEALAAYAADHQGVLPYENVGDESVGHVVWYDALASHMGEAGRICPSVDRSADNYREGYRINSKLAKSSANPPMQYRKLHTLDQPGATVILFDAEYGGRKLSLKGKLNDVEFRHNSAANLLFADWRVERFGRDRLVQESGWLPPKVVWDPDLGRARVTEPLRQNTKKRNRIKP